MKISTKKIEAEMARQGMSRTQLSEKSGLARNNLSRIILRGTCQTETAGKISKALGIDVSEIMEDD